MARFFGRSELELLLITITFQIVALFSLLRVATGVASQTPPAQNITAPFHLPTSIDQNVSIPNSTPQFASPTGNGLDASLFIALVFVGANVVVIGFLAYLYRKRKMKWFSLIISLFLIFNVTELFFTFLTGIYSILPVIAAFAALGITIVAAYRGVLLVVNAMALLLALELGSSFPVLLQAPLNWLIPLVYALFDVYAVYYGRLGKLVREVSSEEKKPAQGTSPDLVVEKSSEKDQIEKPKRRGLGRWPDFGLLSIRLTDIEIGMADIAFYTMVPAVALVLASVLAFIVVMAAVDVGVLFSFALFKRSAVAPGLPVPILLGLGALLVVNLIK